MTYLPGQIYMKIGNQILKILYLNSIINISKILISQKRIPQYGKGGPINKKHCKIQYSVKHQRLLNVMRKV